MNGLCDPYPDQSFTVRVAREPHWGKLALADGDGLSPITAATWKMKGAGVRGSKDL